MSDPASKPQVRGVRSNRARRRARGYRKFVANRGKYERNFRATSRLAEFTRNTFTLSVIVISGISYLKTKMNLPVIILTGATGFLLIGYVVSCYMMALSALDDMRKDAFANDIGVKQVLAVVLSFLVLLLVSLGTVGSASILVDQLQELGSKG